jgi:hypothetical protein
MRAYTAKTLRQFIKRIEKIEKAWESKKDGEPGLWHRGLQKSSWPLIPKLYRPRSKINDLLAAKMKSEKSLFGVLPA